MSDDLAMSGADMAGDIASSGEAIGAAPDAAPAPSPGPASYDAPQPSHDVSEQSERPARPRQNGRFAKAPEPPRPPLSWQSEAAQRVWAGLDSETQKHFADTELKRNQDFSAYGERLKAYEPFDHIVNQYKDDLSQAGLQPAQAFHYLLEAQRRLAANPIQAIVDIGLSYGIDLRSLLEGQGQQEHIAQQFQALQTRYGGVEQALITTTKELEATKAELAKAKQEIDGIKRAQAAARANKVNVRSSAAVPNPKSIDDTLRTLANRAYG